jgi:hypothetical protein
MQASRKAAAEEAGRGKPRDKRPRIARTSRGLGVFAQQRYFARRLIGEVQGTVIDDWGYESRYCMDLGDSRCLEPAAPFRYVNHSCQPNCFIQWRDVTSDRQREPQRRMFLLAIDDIAVGDELTIDYAWPAHMTMPCRCRAGSKCTTSRTSRPTW